MCVKNSYVQDIMIKYNAQQTHNSDLINNKGGFMRRVHNNIIFNLKYNFTNNCWNEHCTDIW